MAVCVLPVPALMKHTTNTVNHKIVKAMVKEDPGPIKFIVSRKEEVNSCFVTTEAYHLKPKAEVFALLNPAPPLGRNAITAKIILHEIVRTGTYPHIELVNNPCSYLSWEFFVQHSFSRLENVHTLSGLTVQYTPGDFQPNSSKT